MHRYIERHALVAPAKYAWHQDQIVELPKDAQVIGGNDHCANAALVYGNKIFTIQPHPELHNQIIDEYLDLRTGHASYPPELMGRAKELVFEPTADMELAADMAAFFKGTFQPVGAS